MQLICRCPRCQQVHSFDIPPATQLHCSACDWQRPLSAAELQQAPPDHCLVCGCTDLWRQKDFPPALGLGMVGLGVILSTIAWANHRPLIAFGVLLGFALVDMLLYTFMGDVLVCYRCAARYRRTDPQGTTPPFNLDTHERHRREADRLKKMS